MKELLGETPTGEKVYKSKKTIHVGEREFPVSQVTFFFDKSNPPMLSDWDSLLNLETGERRQYQGEVLTVSGKYAVVVDETHTRVVDTVSNEIILEKEGELYPLLFKDGVVYLANPTDSCVLFPQSGKTIEGVLERHYHWGGYQMDGETYDPSGEVLSLNVKTPLNMEITTWGVPVQATHYEIVPTNHLGSHFLAAAVSDEHGDIHYYKIEKEDLNNVAEVISTTAPHYSSYNGCLRLEAGLCLSANGLGTGINKNDLAPLKDEWGFLDFDYYPPYILVRSDELHEAMFYDAKKKTSRVITVPPNAEFPRISKDGFMVEPKGVGYRITGLNSGETFDSKNSPKFVGDGSLLTPPKKNELKPQEIGIA